MVVSDSQKEQGESVRSSLLFPDGSVSFVDENEVCNYFSNRQQRFGKDGKPVSRPEVTEEFVRKNKLPALLFSDGGVSQIQVEEIPEFFYKRWIISPKGIISAKKALKVGNNGYTGKNPAPAVKQLGISRDGDFAAKGKSNASGNIEFDSRLSNRKLLAKLSSEDLGPKNSSINASAQNDTGNILVQANKKNITNESIGLIVPEQFPSTLAQEGKTLAGDTEIENNKNVIKPKGWASLFGSNRNIDRGFKVPEIFDGVTKDGVFLKEEHLQPDEHQGLRLVGYFTPRFPGPEALAKVVSSWDSPKCKYYHHRSNWTVFTFDNILDLNRVLEGGPYFAFGKTLYVKKMPPLFEFDWGEHTMLPVWVQLPSLPIECWNWNCLGRICTFIGTPQQADEATKVKERLSFARVLVEVDVSMQLPSKIPVHFPNKTVMQPVLYEDVPKFCKKCQKMGHGFEHCNMEKPPEPTLYTSRAARKFQGKATFRSKQHLESDSEGWIIQQGKNKQKVDNRGQRLQGGNGSLLKNDNLIKINAEKDRLAKEEVDNRRRNAMGFSGRKIKGGNNSGKGIWIPGDKQEEYMDNQGGKKGNKKMARNIENNMKKPDLDSEKDRDIQAAYVRNCKKYGFNPLRPGKRTEEWGLCDSEEEDLGKLETNSNGENIETTDFDDEGESEEEYESGEDDFECGAEPVLVNEEGKAKELTKQHDISKTSSKVINDKGGHSVVETGCNTVDAKEKPGTVHATGIGDPKHSKESKNAECGKNKSEANTDLEIKEHTKEELKAIKRREKKERKAQRNGNGGNASGSTP